MPDTFSRITRAFSSAPGKSKLPITRGASKFRATLHSLKVFHTRTHKRIRELVAANKTKIVAALRFNATVVDLTPPQIAKRPKVQVAWTMAIGSEMKDLLSQLDGIASHHAGLLAKRASWKTLKAEERAKWLRVYSPDEYASGGKEFAATLSPKPAQEPIPPPAPEPTEPPVAEPAASVAPTPKPEPPTIPPPLPSNAGQNQDDRIVSEPFFPGVTVDTKDAPPAGLDAVPVEEEEPETRKPIEEAAPAAPAPEPPQAPRIPEQREVGTVYTTPKGPLRWTGQLWETP